MIYKKSDELVALNPMWNTKEHRLCVSRGAPSLRENYRKIWTLENIGEIFKKIPHRLFVMTETCK